MLSFGVRNLRRLKNVEAIPIKPITVLVGRNSSGKSSYLRAFPLVRQSLMTRTSSPILWYGDFVDFGSFQGAVYDNDTDRAITFIFEVDDFLMSGRRSPFNYPPREDIHFRKVTLEVSIAANQDRNQISLIVLTSDNGDEISRFELRCGERADIVGFTMDGRDVLDAWREHVIALSTNSIFPEMIVATQESDSPARFVHRDSYLEASIVRVIREHIDKRIKDDAVEALAQRLLMLPNLDQDTLSKEADYAEPRSWQRLLKDLATTDSKGLLPELRRIHAIDRFPNLINAVAEALRQNFNNTLYIGPARARSERYYRYQDLSVSEIDADGENFPMFLNSLQSGQLRSLSDWVQGLFGYKVELAASAGHISINLVEGEHSTNIVDTGYGVSQILPVLGQIWWAANRPPPPYRATSALRRVFPNRFPQILAIEQPELHLHPAHQALLADAFAGQTKGRLDDERRLNFLVETHSETLVNRLGELIAQKALDAQDVQVLIFELNKSDERQTNVSIAHFGESGELINWPYGFFQPDYVK